MQFRKAERSKAKLRLGVCGPAGSGKTYSALAIAKGLGGRVAMLDSENGSGDLYADKFEYDILRLSAPFTPERYIEAIKAAEEAKYDVLIIDSLSHAWAGEGGVLEIQGKLADKPNANSYAAWRSVTPRQNKLIEAILQSPMHVIVTMRSKTEYALVENERGKLAPQKMGMAPVQRDGVDYELSVVLDMDTAHQAVASKDRTGLFAGSPVRVGEETGKLLAEWLGRGRNPDCFNCAKTGKETESAHHIQDGPLCADCFTRWTEMQTANKTN